MELLIVSQICHPNGALLHTKQHGQLQPWPCANLYENTKCHFHKPHKRKEEIMKRKESWDLVIHQCLYFKQNTLNNLDHITKLHQEEMTRF